ncbi:hypothetical protein PUN28_009983 [Cardiocondyla obscurior]|uniref:Uncharacterized protein n=1 Tax=Cardiocondyla obscurior TaxID=286306 RepID=A0AAW2FL97_9HYME
MPVIASCYDPPRCQASASCFAVLLRTTQGKPEAGNDDERIRFSVMLSVPNRELRYNFTQVRWQRIFRLNRRDTDIVVDITLMK